MWGDVSRGHIQVNVPLQVALRGDFPERFVRAVVQAKFCRLAEIEVRHVGPVEALMRIGGGPVNVVEVIFDAPAEVIQVIEEQSADPESLLSTCLLAEFSVTLPTRGMPPERCQTRLN